MKPTHKGVRLAPSNWVALGSAFGQIDSACALGQQKSLNIGADLVATIASHGEVDLRKFYIDCDDGQQKPTGRGISLSPEQWVKLKALTPRINLALSCRSDETLIRHLVGNRGR